MEKKHCSSVFVFFTFCALLYSAVAYAGSGSIRVECLDETGKPLKGVQIEILSLNNAQTLKEKTNGEGVAEFKDMDDGVYRVVGRKKNYAPALHEFVRLQSSPESVSLKLEPGVETTNLYFEDPAQIQRASDLMMQGVNASKEGRFDDAGKNLVESSELNPSSSQSIYYLGMYYIQVNNFDKAVETLEKARDLSAMFAALPLIPGVSDPAQQKVINENAQRLISNMAGIKGQLALQEKKYDEAVAALTEKVNNNPNDPDAYYNLALALAYAEQLDQAMGVIDKSIQMKPDESKYSDLKKQISVRKENARIRNAQAALNEGNALLQSGDANGALTKFQEAVSLLSPDKQSIVWRQIGKAQAELKNPAAAEDAYKKAVELATDKDAADYLNSLAQFYLESEKYEEALSALTDPRALGGKDVETVLLELTEKAKDAKPKLAALALERILKANPGNAEANYSLGTMYFADGKERDSRTKELLSKYIEIGKDPEKIGIAKDMLATIEWRSKK